LLSFRFTHEADANRNSFVSFTTSQYKLHYYETPTNTKFVMLTDLKSPSMRIALQQIYINLFVEYGSCGSFISFGIAWSMADPICLVVKNPLSPAEHSGGVGVNNELFEESLEQFVVRAFLALACCPSC
jgi:hypothetical protein